MGIDLDRTNLEVRFTAPDGKQKLKHLIKRTVIDDNGPSATASYDDVFASFTLPQNTSQGQGAGAGGPASGSSGGSSSGAQGGGNSTAGGANNNTLKPGALFSYPLTRQDMTLAQLIKESKSLNTKNFPAAGSALLRSIIEVLLKLMIEEKSLNQQGKLLDLEGALNLVVGKGGLAQDDTKVLKEFSKSHLSYMNLSSHATVVPNHNRLMMARDCIDAFVKRNI